MESFYIIEIKLDNIDSTDKCFICQFNSLIMIRLTYDCCGIPSLDLFNFLKGLMDYTSCLT